MRAESLRFQNVRNHSETSIEGFAERINVLHGPNGAGKTSILESLSLATLTKSFTSSSDAVLIRNGALALHVDAQFRSDVNVPHHVKAEITSGPPVKKTLISNNEKLRSASELIGRAPVVVLTPDDKIITSGAPSERRRFLNMVLSQASHAYLKSEIEFKRALKQRNAILHDAKLARRSLSAIAPLLEPWTQMLIHHGSQIMRRRANFVKEFRPYLLESYRLVSNSREMPELTYLPLGLENSDFYTQEEFAALLQTELDAVQIDEIRRGTSLVGPHRDDIQLFINPGLEAKHYASQGQHKTLLVSMKLAEFNYLREAAAETPILLLDDVFSELDKQRAAELLKLIEEGEFGQSFITSTDSQVFEQTLRFAGSTNRLLRVDAGIVY